MMVRTSLLSCLMFLLLTAPASSQGPAPTGSITIMSRPDGASFRLEGDMKVVGRTPMTFARGLNGPYQITGFEVGYENWSRRIVLDGFSADTIWMSLSRKGPLKAGARSLIVPGWGQFYNEHSGRGWFFMLTWLGSAVTIGFIQYELMDHEDALEAATAPERIAFESKKVEDLTQLRRNMIIVELAVIGVSFVDALFSVPKPVGTVLLGTRLRAPSGTAGLSPGDVEITVPLAQVRF